MSIYMLASINGMTLPDYVLLIEQHLRQHVVAILDGAVQHRHAVTVAYVEAGAFLQQHFRYFCGACYGGQVQWRRI